MAQYLDSMVLELNPIMPPEAFYYFPKDNEMRVGSGAKALRRIFQGQIQFDDFEKGHIKKMKEYLNTHKVTIPTWWEDGHILRFLYANSFKYEKTYKTIKSHTEWREKTLPIDYSAEIENFLVNNYFYKDYQWIKLTKGVFYMHGRDQRFRPIIIINVQKLNLNEQKIETILQSMTYFFEYILKYTMLPGQIENWVVILDLNKIGLSSLPLSALKSVMSYLSSNYRSRMFATYVINTPSSIFIPWSIVKGFLEETTIQKISFFKDCNPEKLFTHTHKTQVEQRFGGDAPNLNIFWPPQQISQKYQLATETDQNLLISQREYFELWETGKLNKNIVCYNYLQSRHNKVPINQIHINDVEQSVINLSSSAIPTAQLISHQNQDFTKSQFLRIDSAPRSQAIRPKSMSQSISQLIKSNYPNQNEASTSKELQEVREHRVDSQKVENNQQLNEQCNNFLNGLTKRDSVQNNFGSGNIANILSSVGLKSGDKSEEIDRPEDLKQSKRLADSNQLKNNAYPISTSSMYRVTAPETLKSINLNQQKFQQTLTSQDLQLINRNQSHKNMPFSEADEEQSESSIGFMEIPFEKIEYQGFNEIRNISNYLSFFNTLIQKS